MRMDERTLQKIESARLDNWSDKGDIGPASSFPPLH